MAVHLRTAPSLARQAARRSAWTRIALVAVSGFSAVNAVAGGIGLLVNGLGVPREQLQGTPFDSFTVPGLLLAIVVGGSMAVAATSAWRKVSWAGIAAVVAGSVMLGWIAIESLMITDGRPLQVSVAVLSLATIALGVALGTRAARGSRGC